VTAGRQRAAITRGAGFELARLAVREGLLGRPILPAASLRARLRSRAAEARGREVRAEEAVLGRHPVSGLDTPAARRADLPAGSWETLLRLARQTGQTLAPRPEGAPGRVRYDPELRSPGGGPVSLGPPVDPADVGAARGCTERLPILLYHRVDTTPKPGPFRLPRGVFEEQLAVLRALGFRSVTLAEWHAAMDRHTPLPGRAVLFTFDDGCRDFLTVAWPLLRRYGFSATIFVTSDAAARGEFQDPLTGERSPALGWDELRALQAQGVQVGSHARRHPFLTRLSPSEVVEELAGSRAEIQEALGREVSALAYPFGDHDGRVRHLAGACGYRYGLTCRSSASGLWDAPLELPRLDVGGLRRFPEFAARLGLGAGA
jgi:peptidoglycan/xylan/chitin deacetylase (PgdA/CDA1 family)